MELIKAEEKIKLYRRTDLIEENWKVLSDLSKKTKRPNKHTISKIVNNLIIYAKEKNILEKLVK